MKRSKLPVVSVNTVFQLEDTKRNGYRWAEVVFDVSGVPAKAALLIAKQARDELDRVMQDITHNDYDDPGDKVWNRRKTGRFAGFFILLNISFNMKIQNEL